ncbi:MAG: putative methyltransferase YcgJ [Pelotomaculum sp. PtaU1.Bin035]|nr:MAG: putative methyltransferase YcgJ [Pelotomaculum sp. PtaU1.Bin035]
MAGTVMDNELSNIYYQKNEELYIEGEWHREIKGLGLNFKNKTVLDLAAGTGHWEEVFLSLGAGKVIWQDLSEYFYEKAQLRLQGNDNIEFFIGDMLSVPLENESVDFVMCRDALFHSPDEKKTVAEIFRVLKEGGYFYLTARNWRRIIREPLNWKSPLKLISPHIYRFTGKKSIPTAFVLETYTLSHMNECGFKVDMVNRGDSLFSILASK